MVKNEKRNFIASLTKRDGSRTISKEEIQDKFLSFYEAVEDGPKITPERNLLVADYGPLLDKVSKTLLAWSGLNLSYAGKLERSGWVSSLFQLRCWIELLVYAGGSYGIVFIPITKLKESGIVIYCHYLLV
ncbi:hypothetical protein M9H77_29490 [Catharanthus roseus]|uniref:Uncharacterized protein n=1 Tax=Catharanthus roseus TaxID=4058 RepID=A0ACB9ZUK0_CATRO|nr:hypothetical protein M9H77_29490 [Catharanthus roseus]